MAMNNFIVALVILCIHFSLFANGEELGQPHYAVPFLAPNSSGQVILHGVNYASGGGGIMNATGRIFVNRLSMDIQVHYFNITRKQMGQLMGKSQTRDYIMKKSIFSITIGSNDFLNNYLLPVLSIGARISQLLMLSLMILSAISGINLRYICIPKY
ncbi:hypothetical protein ACSBR2_002054 [Camellia fascicularis]